MIAAEYIVCTQIDSFVDVLPANFTLAASFAAFLPRAFVACPMGRGWPAPAAQQPSRMASHESSGIARHYVCSRFSISPHSAACMRSRIPSTGAAHPEQSAACMHALLSQRLQAGQRAQLLHDHEDDHGLRAQPDVLHHPALEQAQRAVLPHDARRAVQHRAVLARTCPSTHALNDLTHAP